MIDRTSHSTGLIKRCKYQLVRSVDHLKLAQPEVAYDGSVERWYHELVLLLLKHS